MTRTSTLGSGIRTHVYLTSDGVLNLRATLVSSGEETSSAHLLRPGSRSWWAVS
jgi:hypothetical protein